MKPLESKFAKYAWFLKKEQVGSKTMFDVLVQHLTISKNTLNRDLSKSSSIIAFWASKYSYETHRLTLIQRKHEKIRARKYVEIKAEVGFKPTETEIKSRMIVDGSCDKIQRIEDAQESFVSLLKQIVKVMEVRHESLVNIGATMRKELSVYDSIKHSGQNSPRA